jgi:hypothetical protein
MKRFLASEMEHIKNKIEREVAALISGRHRA